MAENITMANMRALFDEKFGDKSGIGAKNLKLLGGFMELFEEGSSIYESKIDAIRNTGRLLDSVVGKEGLVSRLSEVSEDSFRFFGQIDQGVEATNSLVEGLRSFVMASRDQQTELVNQAALFKALGVQMTDFNAVIDSARLGFQMTSEDAAQLSREVANIGINTGVGMREAMSNFSTAQASMAYDSKKLMENFRALQLTSAQTGVGFDKLTSAFGDSMDTFEGSANKAGTLNAILGRSVFNSIDLLGKTEAQRVETIVKGIRNSVDVKTLGNNKFQLKAISQGLGLSPDETRRLLTGQMTVDEALAQKKSTDPRVEAQRMQAHLLKTQVNPGLEDFGKLLNQMRTAQQNATVSINNLMRNAAKAGLNAAGVAIGSPTEIFETIQASLRAVGRRGGAQEVADRASEIKEIINQEGLKDVLDPTSNLTRAQRAAKAQAVFDKLGAKIKEMQESGILREDIALTPGKKSERDSATTVQQLSSIDLLAFQQTAKIFEPMSGLVKSLAKTASGASGVSLLDGLQVILKVGEKEIKGFFQTLIRELETGK